MRGEEGEMRGREEWVRREGGREEVEERRYMLMCSLTLRLPPSSCHSYQTLLNQQVTKSGARLCMCVHYTQTSTQVYHHMLACVCAGY